MVAAAIIPSVGETSGSHMMAALVYDVGAVRWATCKVIGRAWPGVFWSWLAGLSLRRVAVPALPGPGWVRLRPVLGGICGTDVAAIMQRHHPANILQVFSGLPALLGHENVSVVEAVGAEVSRFRPGDRVVAEPTLSCVPRGIKPVCRQCAAGQFTLCDHFRDGPLPPGSMIGWNAFTGGSWSECFIAHESQLYRVPEAIDDEQAVLVDPIAGALHAALRHRPTDDERVLILGSGLLGMGVAMSLRALGSRCRLYALARHPRQVELMQRARVDEVIRTRRGDNQAARYAAVAATIGGTIIPSMFGHHAFLGGFDVVYDCIGSGQSLTDAMKYARPRGTVVEVGTSQIGIVDTCPLWFDELTLVGTNGRAFERYDGRTMHTYEVVFELIGRGKLDLRGLVTHRFRTDQYQEAFATLADRGRTGAVKVTFEPGSK
ncbi:MAG: alcohol dehydrogenase catalytic domain-containing protein [Planctomycetes bacterium]|nr:alcohol dehydrogenase catalytic domain-containing protein [Planctomycetota bacterium]